MNLPIHNGDHLEFEIEHADTAPEQRPDWPLPSFDARDWAKAWMEIFDRLPDESVTEDWMVSWFANALMRGYDERAAEIARLRKALTEFVNACDNAPPGKLMGRIAEARQTAGEALTT